MQAGSHHDLLGSARLPPCGDQDPALHAAGPSRGMSCGVHNTAAEPPLSPTATTSKSGLWHRSMERIGAGGAAVYRSCHRSAVPSSAAHRHEGLEQVRGEWCS